MDELYNKFTTDFLPKIQEGLVITQEYFTDLFGRYVHYLVIKDSILLVVLLILFFVPIITAYKLRKKFFELDGEGEKEAIVTIGFIVALFLYTPVTIGLFHTTDNLIKDIYLPEIRVYEEISQYVK